MPDLPPPPDETWIIDERRATGERIRSLREERNIRQEGLAHLSGLHRSTIQRIEGGTRDVRLSQLLRIAWALQVPVTDLVPDELAERPPST